MTAQGCRVAATLGYVGSTNTKTPTGFRNTVCVVVVLVPEEQINLARLAGARFRHEESLFSRCGAKILFRPPIVLQPLAAQRLAAVLRHLAPPARRHFGWELLLLLVDAVVATDVMGVYWLSLSVRRFGRAV